MKKILTNPNGFTLVELMVVVAIIGILSAIAVPNFKKYQAKAKQSEAKIQLAALYTAEVGAQADYNTYATCLNQIGYEQSPKGYYLVGFAAGEAQSLVTSTPACGAGTAVDAVAASNPFVADTPDVAPITVLRSGSFFPTGASIPSNAMSLGSGNPEIIFQAGASGCISTLCNSLTTLDKWTIDQTKALVNSLQGY